MSERGGSMRRPKAIAVLPARGRTLRRVALAALLAGLATAMDAQAGAWPRQQGTWFVSLGTRVEFDPAAPGAGPTLFLEHGLTERLTLGIDAWKSAAWPDWMAAGFVRLPLGTPGAPVKLAFSLGAGLGRKAGIAQPVLTGGLHAGRGLPRGWLAADLTATRYLSTRSTDTKLSATWGQHLGGPWTSLLSADISGAGEVQLDQSLVLEWHEGVRLRAGYGRALRGSAPPALTLQTWIEF